MFDVINLSFHPGDGVSHRHVISDVMEIRGTDSSELLNFRADLRLKDDNKVRNCKCKAGCRLHLHVVVFTQLAQKLDERSMGLRITEEELNK